MSHSLALNLGMAAVVLVFIGLGLVARYRIRRRLPMSLNGLFSLYDRFTCSHPQIARTRSREHHFVYRERVAGRMWQVRRIAHTSKCRKCGKPFGSYVEARSPIDA